MRQSFARGLPFADDQAFPDQRWSTYLLLDAHPEESLLLVAAFSVIEPEPRSEDQWQRLLTDTASCYAQLMLLHRSRFLSPS